MRPLPVFLPVKRHRAALRLSLLAATAALLGGCSDASRFTDPFGNPFQASEQSNQASDRVDHTPTGSVPRQRYASNTPIVGQPLPPAAAPAQAAVAAPEPAPVAPQPARAAATSGNWTAQGGTPVVVAQGESAKVLSDRYGVPVEALVRTNGFNTSTQIQPGTRLVIPVYSTAGGRPAAPAAAAPAHVAAAPRAPEPPQKGGKESLHFVKGAQPAQTAKADDKASKLAKANAEHAAKMKLMERGKTAKSKPVDEDEDDKPVATKAKPATRAEAAPAAKSARVEKADVKPESTKVEARKIDPAPTASLPPAQTPKEAEKPAEKTADAATPEFRWPARGRVIQGFKSGGNDGINIALPEGTPIKAAEDGVVAYAGSELKGYGNLVLIRHPNGYVSAYANNGSLDVKRGESVKRGQTIAKSGQTGNVSSPQLHFELRKGATPVDPSGLLAGM